MQKLATIKREYLLITASIGLLFICYQFALKKTLEAWRINKQLHTQLVRETDISYQPAYLERKDRNIGKILDRYKTDTLAFGSNTVTIIASIAEKNNVKLSEVPLQDPLYHTDKFIIQKLNFEGDFFALTKVLNQLQTTNGIGIVRSVAYKYITKRTGIVNIKKLELEVCLETVK